MIFELDRATFRYGDIRALNGVTLSIAPHTRIALLGANGSGKSTLLRMLDALCFPDEGRLLFDGIELNEASMLDDERAHSFRRRVGLVFQNAEAQLFNPTVFDELAFGPLQLGWPKDRVREEVERALVRFGIASLRDRSPHRLSGGERKRVCLASILILDPEVLLLDEPAASLDPSGRNTIIDLLAEQGQRTVITATHDLGIIEDIADLCVVLHEGRIAASGRVADVLQDQELLLRTGLVHAHRHKHADGVVHSHPHQHHEHRH
jgi:cobalt/nickel transport system ATP-binding protein